MEVKLTNPTVPNTIVIKLPSELKYHIGTFCTAADLASLALVHTSCTNDAERVLYRAVALDSVKKQACLQTLSMNDRKASLVQSMSVQFRNILRWHDNYHLSVLEVLSDALIHTGNLHDLRIHLPARAPEHAQDMLNRVLLSGHLELFRLCCNDCLDIMGIIKCHPELEFVGIYANIPRNVFDIVQDIYASGPPSPIPTIIELERDTFLPCFNCITLFPGFSAHPELVCRDVHSSIKRYRWHDTWTSIEHISEISVYFENSSDMNIICNVLDGIASSFPEVRYLDFIFEHASQIQYPEFIRVLAPLASKIRKIHFRLCDHIHRYCQVKTSIDTQIAVVKEWADTLPNLLHFTFLDGMVIKRDNENQDLWNFEFNLF